MPVTRFTLDSASELDIDALLARGDLDDYHLTLVRLEPERRFLESRLAKLPD